MSACSMNPTVENDSPVGEPAVSQESAAETGKGEANEVLYTYIETEAGHGYQIEIMTGNRIEPEEVVTATFCGT